MQRVLTYFVIAFAAMILAIGNSRAQDFQPIEIRDASQHIGDLVTLRGTVGSFLADPSSTTHAFLMNDN
jgi:hypothetical protein